jgi:FlaA1/EpsC-like NDP-sugar epimerase
MTNTKEVNIGNQDKSKGKKLILVTGGSGLIGSKLIEIN